MWGWDELRGTLINDLGALNKVEVGDWDWCKWIEIDDRELPFEPIDAELDPIEPGDAFARESGGEIFERREIDGRVGAEALLQRLEDHGLPSVPSMLAQGKKKRGRRTAPSRRMNPESGATSAPSTT